MPYLARRHQLRNSLLYHIFNRGNARNEIFYCREDYERFIEILSGYEELPFEDSESPQGSKEFVNQLIKEKGLFLPKRRGRSKK